AHAQRRVWDIVYVAPPRYRQMAAQALTCLDREPLTAPDALVIVQIHPRERPDLDALTLTCLRLYDERTYGSTLLMFFEHAEERPTPLDQTLSTSQEASHEPAQ
ncbi:MAG: RsmD family RNA methyltransferase, partial [Ktedonobacterales bacterium]